MTRDELLKKAVRYAYLRWAVEMTQEDVASLLAKVEDGELDELIPLIIDQHMDGHDADDPFEQVSTKDAQMVGKMIVEELGYENPCP